MKLNKENQWVLYAQTAYQSEARARQVIDMEIDQIVIRALNDAVRMHSAVRGVNRDKFLDLRASVLNARKQFKIVKLGVSY